MRVARTGINAELKRFDVTRLGIVNAQGITTDPASGDIFILDAMGPRIVRLQRMGRGGFHEAAASQLDLSGAELGHLRGIAFDPTSGSLACSEPEPSSAP